jgi:hypothetical protein
VGVAIKTKFAKQANGDWYMAKQEDFVPAFSNSKAADKEQTK